MYPPAAERSETGTPKVGSEAAIRFPTACPAPCPANAGLWCEAGGSFSTHARYRTGHVPRLRRGKPARHLVRRSPEGEGGSPAGATPDPVPRIPYHASLSPCPGIVREADEAGLLPVDQRPGGGGSFIGCHQFGFHCLNLAHAKLAVIDPYFGDISV